MVFRLLALDVDGTILRSNHRLDKKLKETIEYVKRKGVYVTLATRRHFASAKKIAKALKLDSMIITHNGAFVAKEIDDAWIESRISPEDVSAITKLLESCQCHVRIKHERFSLANRVRKNQELIAQMTIGDPLFYPIHFSDELHEYVNASPVSPLQIEALFNSEEEAIALKEEIIKRFPDVKANLYDGKRMEIVERKVSKGWALLKLADQLQIDKKEIVAVGDSIADIDMLKIAGLGVAMGNAPQEVKECADWITRSNDQNGVEYMAKEVFRKQLRVEIRSL